jgi:hypothetical protein
VGDVERASFRVGRFIASVDLEAPGGCWLWTGTRRRDGYGLVSVGGKQQRAHRVSYELFVGPIPTGLVLDHLCR